MNRVADHVRGSGRADAATSARASTSQLTHDDRPQVPNRDRSPRVTYLAVRGVRLAARRLWNHHGMVDGYADARVEVRESDTEGFGVFTRREFEAGEVIRVVNVVREIVDDAPLRPDDGESADYCAHADGKVVLYGSPDRYYNHSCDPNAWKRYSGGRIEIVARRPIPAGEEIRLDYLINNSGGESWPCGCSSDRCRGMTSVSFFTIPPEQQRDYLPLLADWFIARHSVEIARLRTQLLS